LSEDEVNNYRFSADRKFNVMMWEDDADRCQVRTASEVIKNHLAYLGLGLFGIAYSYHCDFNHYPSACNQIAFSSLLLTGLNVVESIFSSGDDYLGVAVAGNTVSGFTGGVGTHVLIKEDNSQNGEIRLSQQPAPVDTSLKAFVNGPVDVPLGAATWEATPSNGTGTYAYTWKRRTKDSLGNYSAWQTVGSSKLLNLNISSYGAFQLQVNVASGSENANGIISVQGPCPGVQVRC
jgi:hypothetical protein